MIEVDFDTGPEKYRHWTLSVEGRIATLTLAVDENGGLVPGYELKMNSYDLGVDIELHDALQRVRFEHPAVRVVVVTSGLERMFCAGANIKMLAASAHSWKVNFCKFTNETRNGMEDSSAHSGLTFIAALNGSAAGGGYELALACDQIVLVDDNSSAVSLPEVPLLGVLPGTGGLTRVVDKRGVRRDRADVFATTAEGVRGARAVQWGLVDAVAKARDFEAEVARRAAEAAARPTRRGSAAATARGGAAVGAGTEQHSYGVEEPGVELGPLRRESTDGGIRYPHVRVDLDRGAGTATLTVTGPTEPPTDLHAEGDRAWLLATTRELDDAILRLRTNEPTLGTWLLRTEGDPALVTAYDDFLLAHADDWLVDETIGFYRRTLKRLDTTSRTLFALIEPGSCFAGSLAEIAFAADRQFMLTGQFEDDENPLPPATLRLDAFNLGLLPMGNGVSRLHTRFGGDQAAVEKHLHEDLLAADADALGLVTTAPDDLDWDDELRLAIEERASFSPDALTGLEANLRFAGAETLETKVFGRLSAWQNWIFQRPNAAGPEGALRRYGTGQRADYDRNRA
ncbi:2,3-epoxybenzoyl-CoA dihydrolase [Cryptosporangium phraense]|uniref:Benzoyl-CoA-dihydrodiol lyase n=1 Tax=Cryptosporangium phraense TaxID=2593070 RepID=A0A545ANT5_9ACTN|nr:2,3-epoxybenzoyl-CoA dihydrolase [Cryptosporangium phraense]TQS42994.1 benzoyl-CoA-dihydrodiol lyase [Cryptosporangium phraense]